MAERKVPTEKESARKIKDLKIELLKNPTKKKSIKKEIARLLTMAKLDVRSKGLGVSGKGKVDAKTKLDGENK